MTTTGFSESDLTAAGQAHQNGTQSRTLKVFRSGSDFGELSLGRNLTSTEKQTRKKLFPKRGVRKLPR
ncbi:MAG TPA: hypothetical protein ENG98_01390 [Actinobacteria bacterium]|nr:hypothetical protein [Actinomycetota bacterium]